MSALDYIEAFHARNQDAWLLLVLFGFGWLANEGSQFHRNHRDRDPPQVFSLFSSCALWPQHLETLPEKLRGGTSIGSGLQLVSLAEPTVVTLAEPRRVT